MTIEIAVLLSLRKNFGVAKQRHLNLQIASRKLILLAVYKLLSVKAGVRGVENEERDEAYVAGVRNGRGRKFGREITREEGGVGNLGARDRTRG